MLRPLMIKPILPLLLVLAVGFSQKLSAQFENEFYVGMYCEDRDGLSSDLIEDDPEGYDTAYLKGVADYNFNLILLNEPSYQAPSTNPSTAYLDRIHQLGMKAIVGCEGIRTPKVRPNFIVPNYDPSIVQSALDHYGDHPAVLGYKVMDEPCNTYFDYIGDVQTQIQNDDPTKMAFTNLWPSFGKPDNYDDCLGNMSVQPNWDFETDYVQDYIARANPNMISLDFYPLYKDSRECHWKRWMFENYDIVARQARQADIPTYFVLQTHVRRTFYPDSCKNRLGTSANHLDLSNVPLSYVRYIMYSAMLYGPKGIFFWTRDRCIGCDNLPRNMFFNVWDSPGMATVRDQVGKINEKLIGHSGVLSKLQYRNSYHVSNYPSIRSNYPSSAHISDIIGDFSNWGDRVNESIYTSHFSSSNPILPNPSGVAAHWAPIVPLTATDYLAFSFLNDPAGGEYFWVMNKNLDHKASFQLTFNSDKVLTNVLEDEICIGINTADITLQPGAGKLFRISNYDAQNDPLLISSGLPTGYQGTHSASQITFQGNVSIDNASIAHYHSPSISVLPDFIAHAGSDVLLSWKDVQCGVMKVFDETSDHALENELVSAIQVYPNPTNGSCTLVGSNVSEERVRIHITDLYGREITSYESNVGNGEIKQQIDLSAVSAGVFYVSIEGEHLRQTFKIVKQ